MVLCALGLAGCTGGPSHVADRTCSVPEGARYDFDEDGVCDVDDICVGKDDSLDADLDGTPDACDICPDDAQNDADGDGICDSSDICLGGLDQEDLDLDGIPDFCDVCPEDPLNDTDGDEICDQSDNCPDDPTNDCEHLITIFLKVDFWNNEASWNLVERTTGLPIDSGNFTAANQSYTREYEMVPGNEYCILVEDSYGDGGVRGRVRDEDKDEVLTQWAKGDYQDELTRCFEITD